MTDNKFTWVPFFKEVHEKIHNNYNAEQLANIANEIFGHIKDIDDQGNEVSIQEMTPINFIGYFNRRLTLNNRVLYCKKLREIMNLNSDIPTDFDGIPEFNNQNCLCMPFKKDRANYIIQEQWEISKQILENNIKTELFDKILSNAHPWIGLSYLSRFCFIVKPEKYYPYDKQMAINLNAKMPETFKGYEDYCKLLKYTYPEKTSYELSYEAFMENNNKQNKKQLTSQKKYWIYQPGEQGRLWNEVYANNIIAIGWEELGDLKQYNSEEDLSEKITEIYSKKSNPDKLANWEFANVMNIGDIVYVKKGSKDLIGRGIVQSDYYFDDTRSEYKSVRKIQWTHNGNYNVDFNELGIKQWVQKTLTNISENKYKDFCLKIEDIFMNNNHLNQNDIVPLNQILYGPPGTGKTYNTVIKAMEIINPSCIEYDEKGVVSNYSDVKNEFDKVRDNHQIEFITFHQSYSYEEFVEGIKPDLDTESWNEPVDKLTYKGSNGIFKTIANRALFERLNIQIGQQDAILDFKNLKEMFIEEYSVGSTFKTGTKNAEFRIDKYTKDSARITPTNGKYTYSITFKYLEEAYNKKMTSQSEIATINGVASGLSCYYFAIYEKLLKIKKSNDNNQVKSNMNEMSDEDKLQLVRDYYEGKIKLNNNKISKPYVLIIDEINRGNISKIFGELITLIEEDKRENMSVKLPYSQETFTVPKNLYIIGTMNTSDRSIASIDIALRRRFKFKEMMPNSDLVADFGIGFNTIFDDLNNKIKLLLDRDHQIGHSYFINTKYNNSNGNNNVETLKDIWFSEILPLLNEYFYCDWEKLKLIIPGFIKKLDVPEVLKNECDDSIYEFKTFDEVADFEKALNQEKFEQV